MAHSGDFFVRAPPPPGIRRRKSCDKCEAAAHTQAFFLRGAHSRVKGAAAGDAHFHPAAVICAHRRSERRKKDRKMHNRFGFPEKRLLFDIQMLSIYNESNQQNWKRTKIRRRIYVPDRH